MFFVLQTHQPEKEPYQHLRLKLVETLQEH